MNSAIAGSRIPVVLRPAHLRLYTSSSSSKRTENFYELLELPSRNADQKAIKSQFYKLSMKYHPDRNPNDDAAHTKFIKLNEAYRTLSKENTRREYDRSLDRSSGATTNRGGSGPRGPAMRRTYEPLRPDDWILYRKPGAGRSRIFDFEEHARQHYNNEDFESEARSSARKNARQRYYEELRADQKRQPRVFLTTVILSFGLWLIIHTGAAQMLFLDDE
ncbi:DnaJ domain-containing protein, partial [Zopfochytrium polystomum]